MAVVTNDKDKSRNQMLVELFMRNMHDPRQSIPTSPTVRDLDVRKLRAALILEEVFETIEKGLGLTVMYKDGGEISFESLNFIERGPVNLVELADGLADIEVVASCGTASAFGIAQQPIFELVSGNNLMKFAPGSYFNEKGKLVKPPNHPAPTAEIANALLSQNPSGDVAAEIAKELPTQ